MAEQYRRFTERNEWECEIRHFYIPVTDYNTESMRRLDAALITVEGAHPTWNCYHLESHTVPRSVVRHLVETDQGDDKRFLPRHTILEGRLWLPEWTTPADIDAALVKGGLTRLMKGL